MPADYKPVVITKTPEEIARELYETYELPVIDVPIRGFHASSLLHYGARVGLSESDGETPRVIYFPYTRNGELVGYKAKLLNPKQNWAVGTQKDVDPFGWDLALASDSPKLIITEGEADAVALYQMIVASNKGGMYEHLIPAVISIGHGAKGAVKDLMRVQHVAEHHFKEIILAFDMDEAGQNAAHSVVKEVFGDAKIAKLPLNDPNACLLEGRSKGCVKAVLWDSVVPKNTRIIRGSSLSQLACTKPTFGMPYPWEGLTALTRGRRRGETIYIGAGVKMGKSELVNALAKQIIVDDNLPCFLIKPEESMAKSYNLLVGKAAGRIFHDPSVPFDQEAWDKAEPTIGDKALILDSYQFVDWDTLRGDIKYAVVSEGVRDVIIDPITALTNTVGVSEANEFLVNMSADLSAMAKDLDFTAYIFCHLKAPPNGMTPHERGGKVLSNQFAGSRAMMRSCNYMIGLEGNKDPELSPEQRNMRKLVMLEDREFGSSGSIDLYWDRATGLFNEVKL
ncbi:MAG: hypothetical protein DRN30_06925 [Thermoplasmata archaeon]|nr:MAG: hypothetical protein DRN30_06925 [Thermoplasmata archaeon]